jgi:diguanylate cyclase (GGDEF)-like protein/PAS domain S-box-containing protein
MSTSLPFSDTIFRAAIEGSNSAILITDVSGLIVFANQAFSDVTGYTNEEVIGQNAGFYSSGLTESDVFAEMWSEINEGRDWRGEVQNRRKDGSLYWESLTISPVRDSDGVITHFLSIKDDMAARKNIARALRRNEEQMNTILENMGAGVYIIARDMTFQYVNPEACKILGKSADEIIGCTVTDLFKPEIAAGLVKNNLSVFDKRETVTAVEQVQFGDGEEERYFWSVKVPLFDNGDEVYALLGMSTDITERKRLEDQLQKLAMMDGLTGIFNRRHFFELAEKETRRATRYNQKMGFLMLDIDHFKVVNDTYGHACGDRALQEFAKVVQGAVREADLVARYGGEEFVVALPETSLPGSGYLAERIRHAVEAIELEADDGRMVRFTTSIGGTHLLDENDDTEKALSRADKALYEAKNSGRNRVVFH